VGDAQGLKKQPRSRGVTDIGARGLHGCELKHSVAKMGTLRGALAAVQRRPARRQLYGAPETMRLEDMKGWTVISREENMKNVTGASKNLSGGYLPAIMFMPCAIGSGRTSSRVACGCV